MSAKGRVPHVVLALLDTLRAHPGEVWVVNDGKYVHELNPKREKPVIEPTAAMFRLPAFRPPAFSWLSPAGTTKGVRP